MGNTDVKFYDLECLPNFFCAVFVDYEVGNDFQYVFEISHRRNDFKLMTEFLRKLKGGVGYNIVEYDYPILHELLTNQYKYENIDGETLAKTIREISDNVINSERNAIYKPLFTQRDIYRTWHFFNKARRTSLKWLQFAIGWENLLDYDDLNSEAPEVAFDEIIAYCYNDCCSTKAFYFEEESQKMLAFRREFGKRYGESIMNFSDSAIGEWVILKEIEKRTGITKEQLKGMVQPFEPFRLDEIILDKVEFNTRPFQKVLNMYKSTTMHATKGDIEHEMYYDGMLYKFGSGGIHAARGKSNYHTRNGRKVITSDVSSYYPNLAIQQKMRPRHIGEVFFEIYQDLYLERKTYPKGTPENGGLKISLNSVFGKMNHEKSPLFYPPAAMMITINGQLLLAMLCEMITEAGIGMVVMANTDGIEVDIPVENEARYMEVCDEWCRLTGLELEHGYYKSLYIRDVNNYIGFTEHGPYLKGDYQIDKEFHKDHSMKIVPELVKTILENNLPTDRKSIYSMVEHAWNTSTHEESFKFMLGKRAKSNSKFHFNYIGSSEYGDELVSRPLNKTIRYLVVRSKGGYLDKIFYDEYGKPEKVSKINKGFQIHLTNLWDDVAHFRGKETIHLNYDFYVTEILKLLDPVIHIQEKLFR